MRKDAQSKPMSEIGFNIPQAAVFSSVVWAPLALEASWEMKGGNVCKSHDGYIDGWMMTLERLTHLQWLLYHSLKLAQESGYILPKRNNHLFWIVCMYILKWVSVSLRGLHRNTWILFSFEIWGDQVIIVPKSTGCVLGNSEVALNDISSQSHSMSLFIRGKNS